MDIYDDRGGPMNPRRPDELVVKVIRIGDEDGSLLADHEYGAGATTDEAIEDALRRVAERHGINLEASLLTWDD